MVAREQRARDCKDARWCCFDSCWGDQHIVTREARCRLVKPRGIRVVRHRDLFCLKVEGSRANLYRRAAGSKGGQDRCQPYEGGALG